MDPVTALGVAAAAVQFISFAGWVISKSREIYHFRRWQPCHTNRTQHGYEKSSTAVLAFAGVQRKSRLHR